MGFENFLFESLTMLFVAWPTFFLSSEAAYATKNLVSHSKSSISSFLNFAPNAFAIKPYIHNKYDLSVLLNCDHSQNLTFFAFFR
jgi:hypothetical protein